MLGLAGNDVLYFIFYTFKVLFHFHTTSLKYNKTICTAISSLNVIVNLTTNSATLSSSSCCDLFLLLGSSCTWLWGSVQHQVTKSPTCISWNYILAESHAKYKWQNSISDPFCEPFRPDVPASHIPSFDCLRLVQNRVFFSRAAVVGEHLLQNMVSLIHNRKKNISNHYSPGNL